MNDFLLAESAIRQLYGHYSDAVWRKDTAEFIDCFTEDATWKIAGKTIRGKKDIRTSFEAFLAQSEKVMMFVGMPVLKVSGKTATGRVQATELLKLKDGSAIRTLGVYYEHFVQQGERWLLHFHHFNMSYYGPPDLSAPYFECLDYGPPPGMPGLDAPTTVRGK